MIFRWENKVFYTSIQREVKELVEEAKKHHLISYVWQNGGYTMFGVSIYGCSQKDMFQLILFGFSII